MDYVDEADDVGVVEDPGDGDAGCREEAGCEICGLSFGFGVFTHGAWDLCTEEDGTIASA